MNEISQEAAVPNQPIVETQPAPKLVPQDHVNVLVGKARQEGREKGRQEVMSELSAQQQVQQPMQASQSQSMTSTDPNEARRIVQEELTKHQQALEAKAAQDAANHYATKVVSEVSMKVNDAKTRYPDFDNVVNLKHFQQMPDVLEYVNAVDNSGDVIYDLFKNPSKIGGLRMLPHDLATREIMKLSNSIKQNQLATSNPVTPEPLSQIKPSTIGLDNGSKKSVSDLRNDPLYRG